jgi:16S rRNA (guanine527-N7)-methyltransferase
MDEDSLAGRIVARAGLAGVSISEALGEELARYLGLLLRWNKRMNLTALRDDEFGIDRLVVEPLLAVEHLAGDAVRLMDIGSGGGSPAVPMRLARPDIRLQMVERKARKAAFLREVVRQLSLSGSSVEVCGYEELSARLDAGDRADVVTVRAVKLGERGVRAASGLLKEGGRLFLFEGPGTESGVGAVGFELEGSFPLIEGLESRLVVLRKAG